MAISAATGSRNRFPVIVRSKSPRTGSRIPGQKTALRTRAKKRTRTTEKRDVLVVESARAPGTTSGFSGTKGLVFVGVVFALLLCKLFIRLEILDMSYQIENVRNELISSDAYHRELKAERAIRANPRKITEEARRKLDMRPTMPQQIRRID
jgi:hypothetical protein